MASIISGLLSLRRDPRLLRIPPYLSLTCILVGIVWLLFLPLDEYSRQTYISENALLPGQVHTYFGGSEHNIFRAYRQEVAALSALPDTERYASLVDILQAQGLKVSIQDYRYERAGQVRSGRNVYGIIQGPRADATEAMVMIGAWRNADNEVNYSGVALVLTLARYFKRWSLWSKDIIVLLSADSTAGPQAWVDAYHDTHDPASISSLDLKSGALQGAVAIDYPAGIWGHRFEKLHVVYDGVNGQLPNLDLINTAISVTGGQMGIGCTIQRKWHDSDTYKDRLATMLRGMRTQAIGFSTGPHSSFMPYHIDAITLQAVGNGWQDEMTFGRSVEGLFRSLNNLLEHLHQSFFFYLLMESRRFVSIGTYLPSAMLIAVNFTITSILLWVQSGQQEPARQISDTEDPPLNEQKKGLTDDKTLIKTADGLALVPTVDVTIAERRLLVPICVVSMAHISGVIPFYALHHITEQSSPIITALLCASFAVLPIVTTRVAVNMLSPGRQELQLVQCFSLLVLGAMLSTLATVNFAQSLFIGVLASPLSFVRSTFPKTLQARTCASLATLGLLAISPMAVFYTSSQVVDMKFHDMLVTAAWGWTVEKAWTSLTVWLIWWPAWLCGLFVVCGGAMHHEKSMSR